MDNPVDAIKAKLDIVEFIGSFITLKKTGRNFKANCPFHQEKSPSFVVSPERQIWHCFGSCGEGGDIIKFLMKWENITFYEALKELAQKTGVPLKNVNFEDKTWKRKERFFNMNLLAADFFNYALLKNKFGKRALDYLLNRDIKEATIKKFNLGYSPSSWDSLRLFLKKKNYTDEEMQENGLLVRSESGRHYDRFRGRIMFPLKDSRGNVLGFSGRSLDANPKEAKYINTPETPIYHKRETLFGINLAKEVIKKEKNVYLVEGEFDMIMPFIHGYQNFVAIKGSAVTSEQLSLLKRYTDKITLTLDSDAAGIEAVKRGIEEAEHKDFEISVVQFDFAKDPDEAIRKDEVSFKKTLSKPVPVFDFIIASALKKYSLDDPFDKKKIGDEIIPYIERIGNPIVKSHYVKKIAALLDVPENSVENLMYKITNKKKQRLTYKPDIKNIQTEGREIILEKYILSFIFQSDDPVSEFDKVFAIVSPDDLSIPSNKQICEILIKNKKDFDKKLDLDKFITLLSPELRSVFDELYLFATSEHMLRDEKIEKLIFELKRFSLKRQMSKTLSEEDASDKNKKLLLLTTALKEVEKKLI